MARLLALFVLLSAAPAQSACPEGLIDNALAGRIDQVALERLKGPLLAMLPNQVDIPQSTTTLFTCPSFFDDTTVTPKNGTLTINVRSLEVYFDDGEIVVTAVANVSGGAALDMTLCALPDAVCDANLVANNIEVYARVSPWVNACTPQFDFTELWVYAPPNDVSVWMGNCGLYDDAWNATYDWFREALVAKAEEVLAEAVVEQVPQWLTQMSQDLFADGFRAYDLKFDLAVQSLNVVNNGLVVGFAANATSTRARASCLPNSAKLSPEPPGAASSPLSNAPLSVTAARPFIQRTLRSAWLAGYLCFDSRDYALQLDASMGGMLPNATLDYAVEARSQPSVALGTSVTLNVSNLVAEVELGLGDGTSQGATATVDAALTVAIEMDSSTSMLIAKPNDMTMGDLAVELAGTAAGVDAQSMAGFVQNLVLPTFADTLGVLPITSSLFLGSPVALNLVEVGVTAQHIRADFDLFAIPFNDTTPPLTVVASQPSLPSGAQATFRMNSQDDQTPRAYLRHIVTVDGQREDTPRLGTTIVLTGLEAGTHYVKLAALDLNGNIDATPVIVHLEVDATPPSVVFQTAPIGVLRTNSAELTFAAVDDAPGALTYRYTVGVVQYNNAPDVQIAASNVRSGNTLHVDNLPEDSIVRVTVFAKDQAGNEGSASTSFAVSTHATFAGVNCSASGAEPSVALLVLWLMQRRKRRS